MHSNIYWSATLCSLECTLIYSKIIIFFPFLCALQENLEYTVVHSKNPWSAHLFWLYGGNIWCEKRQTQKEYYTFSGMFANANL
jgi:hypothetical protein